MYRKKNTHGRANNQIYHFEKTNQKLFINARTDGFLQKVESPLETTIKRAKLYQEAGADGLFVTAVSDPATIK
ncbi:MAG TPA: isocitrate lyase/phosphoenolpyruvate mutase family protein, partial [Mucilaginibacter sp.]|nr:isocitrate lyase/phosphoenolpyruvate mutase family protein [Mucilaginibacter sp.]